jgi:hypothetical protein
VVVQHKTSEDVEQRGFTHAPLWQAILAYRTTPTSDFELAAYGSRTLNVHEALRSLLASIGRVLATHCQKHFQPLVLDQWDGDMFGAVDETVIG